MSYSLKGCPQDERKTTGVTSALADGNKSYYLHVDYTDTKTHLDLHTRMDFYTVTANWITLVFLFELYKRNSEICLISLHIILQRFQMNKGLIMRITYLHINICVLIKNEIKMNISCNFLFWISFYFQPLNIWMLKSVLGYIDLVLLFEKKNVIFGLSRTVIYFSGLNLRGLLQLLFYFLM